MLTRKQLQSWVLDYACKYKQHKVISAVSKRCNGRLSSLHIPAVRLACVTLHKIILCKDIAQYHAAIEILALIFKTCPYAVSFKLYAKLVTGIKMVVLLHMLQKQESDILVILLQYFPRTGQSYQNVNPKQLQRMNTAQANFRRFFLSLMANKKQCQEYFQDEYDDEYGDDFHDALRQMSVLFTERIESLLPDPVIEKMMLEGKDKYQDLENTSVQFEMLLDCINLKSSLTEQDLMDLLTVASPLDTEDKVLLPHQLSISYVKCRLKSKIHSSNSQHCSDSDGDNYIQTDNRNFRSSVCKTSESTKTRHKQTNVLQETDCNLSVHSNHCVDTNSNMESNSQSGSRSLFSSRSEPSMNTPENSSVSLRSSVVKNTEHSIVGYKRKYSENKNNKNNLKKTNDSFVFSDKVRRESLSQKNKKNKTNDPVNMKSSNDNVTSSSESFLLLQNYRKKSAMQHEEFPGKKLSHNKDAVSNTRSDQNLVEHNSGEGRSNREHLENHHSDEEIELLKIKTDCELNRCRKRGSISDIYETSDSEDEHSIVPPSDADDLEFWDVFGDFSCIQPLSQREYLPPILSHRRDKCLKLCIVKLLKKMDYTENGHPYEIFS